MCEFQGLQIDMRCVKCGNSQTARASLWEMKNHLYICNDCRLREESRGKIFAWAQSLSPHDASPSSLPAPVVPDHASGLLPESIAVSPRVRPNLFSLLELPQEAGREEVLAAIRQKMRYWMAQPTSAEKDSLIEQLRECQEKVRNDEQYLANERARLQPQEPEESVLLVGTDKAQTIKEFVALCEESQQGWNEGEKHLRSGELEYWILARTENLQLARMVRQAMQEMISDFHALNTVLYYIWPQRPLRLFSAAAWQELRPQDSIATSDELVAFCDGHWEAGLFHLYDGAMLTWLEYAQGCQGLRDWYLSAVQAYRQQDEAYRSLGLELVLQRALPSLASPALALLFDEQSEAYLLSGWDSEIPHCPVSLTLRNRRRGVMLLAVAIRKQESDPAWVVLPADEEEHLVYLRTGDRKASQVTRHLLLPDLARLGYGRMYRCQLQVTRYLGVGEQAVLSWYPMTLTTLPYRQGFRRYLWLWGLRGGLPGLAWQGLAGVVLAQVALICAHAWIPATTFLTDQAALTPFVQALLSGINLAVTMQPGEGFVLLAGAVIGCIGSVAGLRRGHTEYPASQQKEEIQGQGKVWAILLFCGLGFWQYSAFSQLLAGSGDPFSLALAVVRLATASLFCSLLLLLLINILIVVRLGWERSLRRQYRALLHPQGGL
jgi:hypothetical protein